MKKTKTLLRSHAMHKQDIQKYYVSITFLRTCSSRSLILQGKKQNLEKTTQPLVHLKIKSKSMCVFEKQLQATPEILNNKYQKIKIATYIIRKQVHCNCIPVLAFIATFLPIALLVLYPPQSFEFL